MTEGQNKGLNADLIGKDLEKCCRSEELCGECQGKSCNIGFAKECIKAYKKEPKKEIPSDMGQLPTTDFKMFDEVELERAIAHILRECKDCKEDHTEDCIINVIRNCYEVSLLGDTHPYEGTALQYLMYLRENYPKKSGDIAEFYAQGK